MSKASKIAALQATPPQEVQEAVRRWLRGAALPQQQQLAATWVLEICGIHVADGPQLTEREAGFTAGSRAVGMRIAEVGGLTMSLPPLKADTSKEAP